MKVTIKSYTAVASWKWDLPPGSDKDCGICRADFEGTCSKCKYPGDECPIMVGECKHCFHMHCIAVWLQSESSQGRCPMCRQPFREKVAEVKAAGPQTPAGRQPPRNSGGSGASNASA